MGSPPHDVRRPPERAVVDVPGLVLAPGGARRQQRADVLADPSRAGAPVAARPLGLATRLLGEPARELLGGHGVGIFPAIFPTMPCGGVMTSPVGSSERPAFLRSFLAISAISSGA